MNSGSFARRTGTRAGTSPITPENSAMKHLVYGRIILDKKHRASSSRPAS